MTRNAMAVMCAITATVALLLLFPRHAGLAQGTDNLAGLQSYTMKFGGTDRTFGLYVPRSPADGHPRALIVALHGRFSSAAALHTLSHLSAVAEARGALLLYPENVGTFWGDGGHEALGRKEPAPDDVAYIAKVTRAIIDDYDIDRNNVFLVGYDGGGAMAFRLACQPPFRIAGVAVVSALMWQFTANTCPATRPPTPILLVHGRDSELFPVAGAGNEAPYSARRLSAADTVNFWRSANGCSSGSSDSAGEGSALYLGCASGTAVAYVGVEQARQDWPRVGPDYQLNAHGVDAAALIDRFFFNRAAFTLPRSQSHRDATREHILYVPPLYDPKKPTPLMVVLHGRPSSAAEMARISEMNAVAKRYGFIAVYPEGINHEWNAQFDLYNKSRRSVRTSGNEAVGLKQDDVGFLKTLTQDLSVDLNIDRSRMYVAGFSNGGFMTLRMACSGADTFAGFAEVGSSLYPVMTDLCRNSKPSPMLFMHGTMDASIPLNGVRQVRTDGETVRVTLSARETVTLFANRNGCAQSGTLDSFAESGRSPGTKVTRYTPKNCDPSAPIVFYIIEGGGHTWPGVAGVFDEQRFGLTNMDIHASDVIWTFLSKHRLPARR